MGCTVTLFHTRRLATIQKVQGGPKLYKKDLNKITIKLLNFFLVTEDLEIHPIYQLWDAQSVSQSHFFRLVP